MLGFTFLKDYSGSYLENGLEGAKMETTKLLQRSRQEVIMAWTKVAGGNVLTD